MDISFSIVIPTYNESENVRQCIESVIASDDKTIPCDIIVVDNGSLDGTVDIARELGVTVIENRSGKRQTIGGLRNSGARRTCGTIVAFLDGDMVVPRNWLQKAREYFSGGFVGALGFVDVAPTTAGWVGRTWGNRLYQNLDRVVSVSYLPGRNIFVNRLVFEEVNGFDETLTTNEDKDFTFRILRAGFRVISVPDITVIHLGYEKTLREFMKKEFWRQGSTIAFARQRGILFKTLRNPALSLWHTFMMLALIISTLLLARHITVLLAFLWLLPSAVITMVKVSHKSPLRFLLSFFLLTFIRWNVSGVALAKQVLTGSVKG